MAIVKKTLAGPMGSCPSFFNPALYFLLTSRIVILILMQRLYLQIQKILYKCKTKFYNLREKDVTYLYNSPMIQVERKILFCTYYDSCQSLGNNESTESSHRLKG